MFDPGAEFLSCRPFLLLFAKRKEFLQLQGELKSSQNQAGFPFAYQHCVFLAVFHGLLPGAFVQELDALGDDFCRVSILAIRVHPFFSF